MSLIIEDGSQVEFSDSYVTRAELIAFALTLGETVVDDGTTDSKLIQAAIFIGSKEGQLIGSQVVRDQSMAYPRINLTIDGFYWSSEEIPTQLKQCQMYLALDLIAGVDLYNPPTADNVAVKREKIDGAVEVEYATKEEYAATRYSQSVALLSSLMRSTSMFSIPLVRA